MFIGFSLLNGTLPDWLQVTDASGTPLAADAPPTYRVFSPAGVELIPAAGVTSAIGGATGLYLTSVPLLDSSGFEMGERFYILYSWTLAGVAKVDGRTFGVV
jgi:hypothetical protein